MQRSHKAEGIGRADNLATWRVASSLHPGLERPEAHKITGKLRNTAQHRPTSLQGKNHRCHVQRPLPDQVTFICNSGTQQRRRTSSVCSKRNQLLSCAVSLSPLPSQQTNLFHFNRARCGETESKSCTLSFWKGWIVVRKGYVAVAVPQLHLFTKMYLLLKCFSTHFLQRKTPQHRDVGLLSGRWCLI